MTTSHEQGGSAIGGGEPVTVVVADDHPVYRQGLVDLLVSVGIEVLSQVPNGEAAVAAAIELAPDVVVMDLNMPGTTGFEATRIISERVPSTKVLVLTVSAQESDVVDAIVAGASGYVLKDGSISEIVGGIRAAAAGESLISPQIADTLLERIRERSPSTAAAGRAELSARELEILGLVAAGMGSAEIAKTLHISQSTARNHTSNILLKLQVDERVQAAVVAVREGMV